MVIQPSEMPPDTGRGDERKGIERELKRGSLELIVLHLLAPGEAYGYEIVSTLAERTDGALEVTDGTLYPVLYRLERAGFVSVRWGHPVRGVPRNTYKLTVRGAPGARPADGGVDLVRKGHAAAAAAEWRRQMTITADDYVRQVLARMPRTALRSRVEIGSSQPDIADASSAAIDGRDSAPARVIPRRSPSPISPSSRWSPPRFSARGRQTVDLVATQSMVGIVAAVIAIAVPRPVCEDGREFLPFSSSASLAVSLLIWPVYTAISEWRPATRSASG